MTDRQTDRDTYILYDCLCNDDIGIVAWFRRQTVHVWKKGLEQLTFVSKWCYVTSCVIYQHDPAYKSCLLNRSPSNVIIIIIN